MTETALIKTPVAMADDGIVYVEKLNLGCGVYPIEGYTNVDFLDFPGVDIVGDFTKMAFAGVREVEMSHVLEHVSWQKVGGVMRMIRSWMVQGGSIRIEVPDMEVVMGRGIYDMAAQIAIYGIQDAFGEFHLSGYTWVSLRELLIDNGFTVTEGRSFVSEWEGREGLPCLEVKAVAA